MPYSPPPTFVAGTTITAANLNILSEDIAFINGLSDYVNPSQATYTYALSGTQSMAENSWFTVHRNRYLHYYLVLEAGSITNTPHVLHMVLDWGAGPRDVWSAGVVLNAPYTVAPGVHGYLPIDLQGNDLSSVPLNIPLGSLLQIWWDANTTGRATAYYFIESDFTTL